MAKEITVKVPTPQGLHARPAGIVAKVASEFGAQITAKANGLEKNAKSVMALMSLGVQHNQDITFTADGPDADAALQKLQTLFTEQLNVH